MAKIKEHYIRFILYMAVIVLVNLAGLTLFFRADLTRAKVFSLSEASKEVVATLSEPLSIKIFFSKDLPAPHNNTERYLKDLMEEYGARGGKYFNYAFYNVSPEEGSFSADKTDANREMARSYGISPVQIRIMENDEVKFKNAYMGLVIIHGDLIEKIEAITATDGLEYKLTTAIQKLNNKVSALLRIQEKVKVKMILSSSLNPIAPLLGLENRLPGLAEEVTKAIQDLNTRSMGIIEFEHLDLTTRQDLDAAAKKYNLMALSWPAIPERNLKAGQGAAGLILEYRDKAETFPLISAVELPLIGTTYQLADIKALGEELTLVIEKMIGINQDIGYLADHGTQTLGPDRMAMMQGRPGGGMQVFNDLLSSRYDIRPVSLKQNPVPEGLSCLIIAKPTEKFTEFELFQIDQALMRGTNIAFFSDAFDEVMPQGGMGMPQYLPIETGLEKLLTHYGIGMKQAYVLDKSAYRHPVSPSQGGGEQIIYFAPMLKEKSINNEPAFMGNIKGLVAMQISPLERIENNIDKDRVKAVRLLSSSEESWLMEGMINLNPMFISPPDAGEDMKSYDLAYILEGSFTSYFKGKPVPEKETGEAGIKEDAAQEPDAGGAPETGAAAGATDLVTQNRVIESSKPAKIFVLGCSQMLQDNMLDPEGRSTNATFILNVIDHLNGRDKIAVMRSKQQTLNPIVQTTPFTRGMIKGFNIAALPVLVILFGMGVLVRRNARKRKIARIFEDKNGSNSSI